VEALDWRTLPEHWLPIAILAVGLLVLILGRVFRPVGFSYFEIALLVVVAPLLSEADVVFHTEGQTTLAFNVAGFLIPVLLVLKFMLEGKAPFLPTLGCFGIVTGVAYLSSFAVPNQGVLLYYRIPAAAAVVLAVVLRWGTWHQAGPMAYSAGALGVIVGADALRLHELMSPAGSPHRIVIGGAGMMDGIFLVAALAVAGCLVVAQFHRSFTPRTRARRGPDQPAPVPPDSASANP